MKLASALLAANALAVTGCATYPGPDAITFTGHFTYLDSSLPGCGNVALASRANFAIDKSHQEVEIAVPCIEMQFTTDAAGTQGPLKVGERYTVVLTREKPIADILAPYLTDKNPWYLSSVSR